jgi:hypothetical protein
MQHPSTVFTASQHGVMTRICWGQPKAAQSRICCGPPRYSETHCALPGSALIGHKGFGHKYAPLPMAVRPALCATYTQHGLCCNNNNINCLHQCSCQAVSEVSYLEMSMSKDKFPCIVCMCELWRVRKHAFVFCCVWLDAHISQSKMVPELLINAAKGARLGYIDQNPKNCDEKSC